MYYISKTESADDVRRRVAACGGGIGRLEFMDTFSMTRSGILEKALEKDRAGGIRALMVVVDGLDSFIKVMSHEDAIYSGLVGIKRICARAGATSVFSLPQRSGGSGRRSTCTSWQAPWRSCIFRGHGGTQPTPMGCSRRGVRNGTSAPSRWGSILQSNPMAPSATFTSRSMRMQTRGTPGTDSNRRHEKHRVQCGRGVFGIIHYYCSP